MDASIQQRVVALRKEIAEIAGLSLKYLQTSGPAAAETREQQSREQRLKEIMDELKSISYRANASEPKP